MISPSDIENLTKAEQTADLLTQDLRAVASSSSAMLSDAALDLLAKASELQKAIKRLNLAAASDAEGQGDPN